MAYTDISLTCSDCGDAFVFTAGEQEFHAQKGFSNRPGRCSTCRARRKNSNGGGGGSSHSGGRSSNYPDRPMFQTTCSSCGQQTHVPFQPSQDRPTYCRPCYATQGARRPSYR